MRPGLPDPLIALLGARWAMGAPVLGAAWFGGAPLVGFALADGSIATAPAVWDGAATLRPREAGGVELVPAREAPPPVMRASLHQSPCIAVIGDGADGLLCGGGDGLLAAVAADGSARVLGQFVDAVEHVAAAAAHHACVTGHVVHRLGADPGELDLRDRVHALAFDPTGRHLAIGRRDRVTIWSGEEIRDLSHEGTHQALAWSPDGRYLVSGVAEGRVHAWTWPDGPEIALGNTATAPLSLSFAPGGRVVAASGGARVVCWHLRPPPGRRECGVASTAAVIRVACHPWRTLIAAGYENGAVLLCQPDSTDILFVRAAGGGGVTTLTWSADGAALAIGTAGGEIGVVAFPDLLFRPAPQILREAS